MYEEWGGAPSAGVITGLARIHTRHGDDHRQRRDGQSWGIFPDDVEESYSGAEHRAGKSHSYDLSGRLRGHVSATAGRCFPDTDDFGRVFRNNAVMSAMGIPQIAAIMGMCVAGGGYLPVMCDHVLMTDGSGLFLAGPALVQAAIGQKFRRKIWVGRRCTHPSAARWIFASRMTKHVSRAFVHCGEVGLSAPVSVGPQKADRPRVARGRNLRHL